MPETFSVESVDMVPKNWAGKHVRKCAHRNVYVFRMNEKRQHHACSFNWEPWASAQEPKNLSGPCIFPGGLQVH